MAQHWSETWALVYLYSHGLRLVARNFSCRSGEIDLIMRASSVELVFVEVRYRADRRFGGAAASVTSRKRQRIIRTAGFFISTHDRTMQNRTAQNRIRPRAAAGPYRCRFDVVAVEGRPPRLRTNWIRGAFSLS